MTEDEVADDVLVDRVKAAMAQATTHDEAIEVTVHNGIVVLNGRIVASELPALTAAVRNVNGVKDVVSDLQVYLEEDNLPELHGSLINKAAAN
jgi:osmotically-inducible protein OsmY